MCYITIVALFDTYSGAYGVGCVLILLAIMSMQIGLQWRYSIWCSIILLAYYIIAGEIWRSVPTVVVMLFIGALLYSQASHASEYFVR
jgi:signal transduction histidine kinase